MHTSSTPAAWTSRIPGFYELSRTARLQALVARGFLTSEQAAQLERDERLLEFSTADHMVENVVGCFELPIGIGLNFLINGKSYAVPMVVEEPSVVAAVSHAAKLIGDAGGFFAEADRSVMTGQIQVVGCADAWIAKHRIDAARAELIELANAVEPKMRERGGGPIDLDVRILGEPASNRFGTMLVVHLYIDACDAMGANLVNSMCEGIAAKIEEITGGRVFLRILTNLTDRRRARSRCEIPVQNLAWHGFSGAEVAEGIVCASEFAEADPYRAATHNKGIMNGIDAAAIAVGQDWRAIEAGAHSFAAESGQYSPLAVWRIEHEKLVGQIDVPMAVGIVGGPIRLHPTVQILLSMLNVASAAELACVLASVGLAQNLAAIKALGSTGIQRGHMSLHARSVAATAGARADEVNIVAARMVAAGEIKVEKAQEILAELRNSPK